MPVNNIIDYYKFVINYKINYKKLAKLIFIRKV
jgi:hypothetical protein